MNKFERMMVRWAYTCVAAGVLTFAVAVHKSVSAWLTLLLVVIVVALSALAMERD